MSEIGIKKAAILMLALGEDEAAEVMKFLDPREVQKLGVSMSSMKSVMSDELEEVLDDFYTETAQNTSFGLNSDDYIRNVLIKALGDDKAASLLNRILGTRETGGIESLKWMDAKSVSELIRNEHPQIIATILVHLEPYHACEVMNHFSESLRNDAVLRIATLDGVQPAALDELNEALTRLLTGNKGFKKPMGGIQATAEILNFLSGESETSVMNTLKNYDADMAQKIMDEMFIFDSIVNIEDRNIQLILREVESDSLITALKGASQELRDKIFKNMSERAAEMMREDLEAKGPVLLSEVETQQKAIMQIVRTMADEGKITLGARGTDAYV
ncbi:MAG: flagellar motor switch protein FliG [Pseudomonadota bacterium]